MDFEKRGLILQYIRDWSLFIAGWMCGVPKIFAAFAASLDNLPLLKLSTLNQIKLQHNPLDSKGLRRNLAPPFACTEIHAHIGYSPCFLKKRGGYSKVNSPCFPAKRGIKSE